MWDITLCSTARNDATSGPYVPRVRVCGLGACEMVCFLLDLGTKRKIVTSISSEKVEAFSLHFERRTPTPSYTYFFKPHCWVKRLALSFLISLPSSLTVIDYCNSFLHSFFPASDFSFPWLVFLILSVKSTAVVTISLLICTLLWLPTANNGKIKVLRMASKASQEHQTLLFHIWKRLFHIL